jgi:hypothetical protein
MVRHAGLFCNRWRECHLARARKALRLPAPSNAEPPRPPPWAQRQEKLIGKDPLVCPRCHVPLLLVLVAFGPWDGLQQRSPASPSTRRRTSNRPTAAARAARIGRQPGIRRDIPWRRRAQNRRPWTGSRRRCACSPRELPSCMPVQLPFNHPSTVKRLWHSG